MQTLAYSAMMLGVIVILSKLGEEVFSRLRLPSFLGALAAGIFLGPSVLGMIHGETRDYLALFTMLGIDFLLFIAGAEEMEELEIAFRKGIRILALGASFFAASTLVLVVVLYYIMGLDPRPAAVLGVIIAAVSAGPLVKGLMDSGLISSPIGKESLLAAISAEVSAIATYSALTGGDIARRAIYVAAILSSFYVFGRLILTRLLRVVEEYVSAREAPFAVMIGLILLAGYMAELTGFSAALMALGLGIFSSSYLRARPDIMGRIKAFTYGFFEPLFFAGLGLYLENMDTHVAGLALLLGALNAASKLLVSKIAMDAYAPGLLMLSKGGVDGALLLSAYRSGIISPDYYDASLLVLIFSTLAFAASIRRHIPRHPRPARGLVVGSLDLERVSIDLDSRVSDVIDVFTLLEKPAAIVVDDEDHPVGVVRVLDLLFEDPRDFARLKVKDIMRRYVPRVGLNDPITPELLEELSRFSVAAVVDGDDRLLYSLYIDDVAEYLSVILK